MSDLIFSYWSLKKFCQYQVPAPFHSGSETTACRLVAVVTGCWKGIDKKEKKMLLCKQHLHKILEESDSGTEEA